VLRLADIDRDEAVMQRICLVIRFGLRSTRRVVDILAGL
jgi:hypothetical protein